MATYYVSNAAVNGYPVGNDANAGSAAAPFLTMGKAVATTNAGAGGDTIIVNDGAYLTTDGANGATYLTVTKAVTINHVTALGATITSTNASYNTYINPGATGVYTLGALILNCNLASFTGITVANTAFNPTLILNGTKVLEFTGRGFRIAEDNPTLIQVNDAILSTSSLANNGTIADISALASGNVEINGLDLDITSIGALNEGIKIASSTGTGSTVTISGVTGTVTNTVWGYNPGVISINNVPGAVVEDCDFTASLVGGVYVINIITGANCIIRNNNIAYNSAAGYAIYSNADDTDIYGNTVTNNNANQGATPHGIVLVDNTGGEVYGNTVSGFAPAFLGSKTDASTIFHHNTVLNPYGVYQLYCKGATGTKFEYNWVYAKTGYNGVGLALQAHADATNNTNVEFTGNILFNTSANPVFVYCTAGQTGIFTNNMYFASQSLIATSWRYNTVDYATFAAWKAAVEPTAIWGIGGGGLSPGLGLSGGHRPPWWNRRR